MAICTFGRDQLLVDSIREVLSQEPPANELLIVDQTPEHEPSVRAFLESGDREGKLRWIRQSPPSLCLARNRSAAEARSEVVLFVDDDVLLPPGFVEAHRRAYVDPTVSATVGRIHIPRRDAVPRKDDPTSGEHSRFSNDGKEWSEVLRGSNFSVKRAVYGSVGGFDENLVGSVYFDEADFAKRLVAAGHRIRYVDDGWQIHLVAPTGGCRISGNRSFSEWTKSVNFMTYFLRYPGDGVGILKQAVRAGPLRRENVVRPWRWPWAWMSFGYAAAQAWTRSRARVKCSYEIASNLGADSTVKAASFL